MFQVALSVAKFGPHLSEVEEVQAGVETWIGFELVARDMGGQGVEIDVGGQNGAAGD